MFQRVVLQKRMVSCVRGYVHVRGSGVGDVLSDIGSTQAQNDEQAVTVDVHPIHVLNIQNLCGLHIDENFISSKDGNDSATAATAELWLDEFLFPIAPCDHSAHAHSPKVTIDALTVHALHPRLFTSPWLPSPTELALWHDEKERAVSGPKLHFDEPSIVERIGADTAVGLEMIVKGTHHALAADEDMHENALCAEVERICAELSLAIEKAMLVEVEEMPPQQQQPVAARKVSTMSKRIGAWWTKRRASLPTHWRTRGSSTTEKKCSHVVVNASLASRVEKEACSINERHGSAEHDHEEMLDIIGTRIYASLNARKKAIQYEHKCESRTQPTMVQRMRKAMNGLWRKAAAMRKTFSSAKVAVKMNNIVNDDEAEDVEPIDDQLPFLERLERELNARKKRAACMREM